MSWVRFFRRKRSDAELQEEIENFLTEETADNEARGMSPDDARRQARHLRRSAFERLRDGTARRIVRPGQLFSRIHIDDLQDHDPRRGLQRWRDRILFQTRVGHGRGRQLGHMDE